MNILAIIPGRGGSKGVPNKNIKELKGHPLIDYSIITAHLSKLITRTIVSTDSIEIAGIAKKYGAEVPFLRPNKYAKDDSRDIEYVLHALEWLSINEKYIPDYIVQLRPTTPLRKPEIVDKAIKKILNNNHVTSLRSVHELAESPYKMFTIEKYLVPYMSKTPLNVTNYPRQLFPIAYKPNGYVDILKVEYVLTNHDMYGNKILPFITEPVIEVDTMEDFKRLEFKLR